MREVHYEHAGLSMQGVLTFDRDARKATPVVLVFHGIEGRSDPQLAFAKKLTALGYAAFASF